MDEFTADDARALRMKAMEETYRSDMQSVLNKVKEAASNGDNSVDHYTYDNDDRTDFLRNRLLDLGFEVKYDEYGGSLTISF